MDGKRLLLVGDNPFHGISHLSQARAASRGADVGSPERGAGLVAAALDHGADGFMFSASETTLGILRRLVRDRKPEGLRLYVIVPYAYEYVRMAVRAGGVPGLARGVGRQILASGNWRAVARICSADPGVQSSMGASARNEKESRRRFTCALHDGQDARCPPIRADTGLPSTSASAYSVNS